MLEERVVCPTCSGRSTSGTPRPVGALAVCCRRDPGRRPFLACPGLACPRAFGPANPPPAIFLPASRALALHPPRMGTLYYGDWRSRFPFLGILTSTIPSESADLVYLAPPFNTAQNCNAFFQEKNGTATA